MKKNSGARTLIISIGAAVLVVLFVVGIMLVESRNQSKSNIVLPGEEDISRGNDSTSEGTLLQVTKENVSDTVLSLHRPSAYYQALTAVLQSNRKTLTQTVEVWVSGKSERISVTENGRTKNILTDGRTAFIWYKADDRNVRRVSLPEDTTADQLSGIPTYETVAAMPASQILQAEYTQAEDTESWPCLFVKADDGAITDYYLDLTSGLLRKAYIYENGTLCYSLEQKQISVEENGSDRFASMLKLPDGTDPFSTEAE